MNYVPHSETDRAEMLKAIGVGSVEELFSDVPASVRLARPLNLPGALSELELVAALKDLAARNADLDQYTSFLGAGAYEHFVPSLIDHMLLRSEFYTAYTPYQPEISQGTLQAIFEYQTLICELTGMDVANASMYDGATAIAESAIMACEQTRRKQVLVAVNVHPDYRAVLKSYMHGHLVEVKEIPFTDGVVDNDALKGMISNQTACVIVQNPNFFGLIEKGAELAEIAHQNGALFVVCADPVSLGILKAPGDYGADIVVGEGQGLGNAVSFGGPYLGFMACKEKFTRRMPGRIVGQTVDRNEKRGFVLTLQAREQHIRREKATSNICSNEALCALAATIYLVTVGKEGLKQVANLCLQKAHYAQKALTAIPGVKAAFSGPFFQEFAVTVPKDPEAINRSLLGEKIIGGLALKKLYPELTNSMLFCVTEVRTKEQIDRLVAEMGGLA